MIEHGLALKESLEYFNGNELAANAFIGKYALRDSQGRLLESNPSQMHRRLAKEFARIESKYPNPMSEEEIYSYLRNFARIIPQGSPMAGIGNPYQLLSLSNCFVIESPADSYGGICLTDEEEAEIMKRRGGVGFDISTIRPRGLATSNAAQTTDGIGVFMERFSNTCREVAQGGRRGALMLSISCHHPEIETFIQIKKDLKKVTGANISVRFTDEFMQAVESNTDVELRWPVDSNKPKISRKVNAKNIWNQFVEAAWNSAEPGALFWDTAVKRTPADAYVSKGFGSKSTNPCGEIVLSPYDSCRLTLVNAMGFVSEPFKKTAKFDWKEFEKACYVGQRLMDDMIDLELEAVDRILSKIDKDPEPEHVKDREKKLWTKIKEACSTGRRTGLGLTAVGDALASLGMVYGSEDSIRFTEHMYRTLAVGSYQSSVDMARDRGAFPAFDSKLEQDHEFIQQIVSTDPELKANYTKHGRRNIANTTTPPAGTTSLLACLSEENKLFGTTSGIEPAYLLSYKRRKKINPNDTGARVDFTDELGDKWTEFMVYHSGYKLWMDTAGLTEETANPESSPYWKATSADVNWINSVDIQAAAQKWICHSISKTCVAMDSLIETEHGLMYADELFEGESILSGEEKQLNISVLTHENRMKNATVVINQGLKPVFELTLANGLSIKATPDEKFLRLNEDTGLCEWVELNQLTEGDRVRLG